jgi:hypothetical protein
MVSCATSPLTVGPTVRFHVNTAKIVNQCTSERISSKLVVFYNFIEYRWFCKFPTQMRRFFGIFSPFFAKRQWPYGTTSRWQQMRRRLAGYGGDSMWSTQNRTKPTSFWSASFLCRHWRLNARTRWCLAVSGSCQDKLGIRPPPSKIEGNEWSQISSVCSGSGPM